MADSVRGADPDHLDGMADALGRGARQLAAGSAELGSMVRSLEWSGTVADRMRVGWLSGHQQATTRAVEAMGRADGALRSRAATQRNVSAPDPRSVPARAAHSLLPLEQNEWGDRGGWAGWGGWAGAAAVEVLGDPVAARHVAVVVPGMGTTLHDLPRLRRDAERLRSTAGGGTTAFIVWVGSATPPGWLQAASDRPAQVDGASLARFVAELRAHTAGDLTVIGHSYGSTTMAWAVRAGLDGDRLVALGSPGLGVERLEELGLPDAVPLYAAVSEGDPVAHLRWFGNDPTAPGFGAQSFDAGVGGGHSGYFEAGSVSLDNLARIVRGEAPTLRTATPWERWVDDVRTRSRLANDTIDDLQARLGPVDVLREVDGLQMLERLGTSVAVAIGGVLDDWAHHAWG